MRKLCFFSFFCICSSIFSDTFNTFLVDTEKRQKSLSVVYPDEIHAKSVPTFFLSKDRKEIDLFGNSEQKGNFASLIIYDKPTESQSHFFSEDRYLFVVLGAGTFYLKQTSGQFLEIPFKPHTFFMIPAEVSYKIKANEPTEFLVWGTGPMIGFPTKF